MANNNHLYADQQARLDTIIGQTTALSVNKYEHWRTLRLAKNEFENMLAKQGLTYDVSAFYSWMTEEYGIRLQQVEGMIGPSFDIVDEQKYLIYKLKFV